MIKTLLIYPYTGPGLKNYSPPLGLAYIAGMLKKKNCKIKIIDFSAINNKIKEEEITFIVNDFQPDIIAFSILVTGAKYTYRFINEKLSFYKGLIVAGGPHCTVLPEEPLKHSVDIVVRNEGEETISELIDYLEGKIHLKDIKGISYIKKSGEIVHNAPRPPIENLDSLPFPAFELFNKEDYPVENMGRLIASRGCPGKCSFCANQFFHQKIRVRSSKNIFEEIKHIYNTYKINYFEFYDDNFTINRKRIFELCDLLQNWEIKIEWTCLSRVDFLEYELLRSMKSAGCKRIHIGVESANIETLKRVKKNVPLNRLDKILDQMKELGIQSFLFFMFGFPWETAKEIRHTNKFIKKMRKKVDYFNEGGVLIPYPGTEIYEEYKDKIGFKDWWLSDWLPENFEPLHKIQPWYFFPYTKQQRKEIKRGLDIIVAHNLKGKIQNIKFSKIKSRFKRLFNIIQKD